jgi:hypothetical protein
MAIRDLEAFLWHPYSALFKESSQDFRLNDTSFVNEKTPSLSLVLVPRSVQNLNCLNISDIVSTWADVMQLNIIVANHLVICKYSRDVFLIDYVLESASKVVLLCIENEPVSSTSSHMFEYMSRIKAVSGKTMGIHVDAYVLSIYGKDTPHPKLFSSVV